MVHIIFLVYYSETHTFTLTSHKILSFALNTFILYSCHFWSSSESPLSRVSLVALSWLPWCSKSIQIFTLHTHFDFRKSHKLYEARSGEEGGCFYELPGTWQLHSLWFWSHLIKTWKKTSTATSESGKNHEINLAKVSGSILKGVSMCLFLQ